MQNKNKALWQALRSKVAWLFFVIKVKSSGTLTEKVFHFQQMDI